MRIIFEKIGEAVPVKFIAQRMGTLNENTGGKKNWTYDQRMKVKEAMEKYPQDEYPRAERTHIIWRDYGTGRSKAEIDTRLQKIDLCREDLSEATLDMLVARNRGYQGNRNNETMNNTNTQRSPYNLKRQSSDEVDLTTELRQDTGAKVYYPADGGSKPRFWTINDHERFEELFDLTSHLDKYERAREITETLGNVLNMNKILMRIGQIHRYKWTKEQRKRFIEAMDKHPPENYAIKEERYERIYREFGNDLPKQTVVGRITTFDVGREDLTEETLTFLAEKRRAQEIKSTMKQKSEKLEKTQNLVLKHLPDPSTFIKMDQKSTNQPPKKKIKKEEPLSPNNTVYEPPPQSLETTADTEHNKTITASAALGAKVTYNHENGKVRYWTINDHEAFEYVYDKARDIEEKYEKMRAIHQMLGESISVSYISMRMGTLNENTAGKNRKIWTYAERMKFNKVFDKYPNSEFPIRSERAHKIWKDFGTGRSLVEIKGRMEKIDLCREENTDETLQMLAERNRRYVTKEYKRVANKKAEKSIISAQAKINEKETTTSFVEEEDDQFDDKEGDSVEMSAMKEKYRLQVGVQLFYPADGGEKARFWTINDHERFEDLFEATSDIGEKYERARKILNILGDKISMTSVIIELVSAKDQVGQMSTGRYFSQR